MDHSRRVTVGGIGRCTLNGKAMSKGLLESLSSSWNLGHLDRVETERSVCVLQDGSLVRSSIASLPTIGLRSSSRLQCIDLPGYEPQDLIKQGIVSYTNDFVIFAC